MARVGASDNLQPKSSFDIQMTQSTKGNNNENSSGGEGGSCESSSGDNSSSNGIKLKKEISLLDGVAIIVGVIVGSGIFVSPKGVLIHSGSILQSIIVWILSGILSLVGALCYAELGTMIPKSGGDYAYIDVAFGPLPAFLYLWVALLILIPTGNAITALTFAQYLLQPFWPSCEAPVEAVQLLAAVITCFLTMVNCYNVKWVTRITDIFTGTKILALLIIVGAGAYYLFTGNTEKWDYPLEGSQLSPGFIALAFYNGLFSYSGWNYLNYVTEELKDPYKNLPRAICISLPLVTTIYVVTNIAYFSVLTPDEILSSEAVAVTFGDKMLGFMAWLMPFFVACSTFGALNGAIFGASRLLFVGARNGHLPAAISLINVKFLTPIPSLLFLGVVTLILLFIRDMYALINYVQFVEAFFTFMSISGLLWLRKKNPDSNRPIKVNLSLPILYLIICGFLMISSIYVSPMEVGIGSAIIVSGIPIYYLTIYRPVELLTSMSQKLNIWCSKFFLCMPNQEKID